MSLRPELTLAQARILIARLSREPLLDSPTADEMVSEMVGGDGSMVHALFSRSVVDVILALPDIDRVAVSQHMALMSEKIEVGISRRRAEVNLMKAAAEKLRHDRERERADDAEAALLRTERAGAVAAEVSDRLKEISGSTREPVLRMPSPYSPAAPVPTIASADEPLPVASLPPAVAAKLAHPGFKLSDRQEEFFRAKRYPGHTEHQNRTTMRLWYEINGDKVPSDYTRRDVMNFQASLRELPSSHNKGLPRTAPELIAEFRGKDVDRLADKTIQRHFSLMRQVWKHLGEDEANPRIWSDIEHHLEENSRIPWTSDALDLLLRARWNPTNRPGNRISEHSHAWFIAIGAYTGCRIEEIARIEVSTVGEMFEAYEGIQTFSVRAEVVVRPGRRKKVGWTPKSKAGTRKIPIHPKLIEAGLLDLASARKAAGERYLFDLNASGPGGKLSVEYSREFSRFKIALGIGPDTVFHSFRHNVETILGSKRVRQEWTDAFMGHASPGRGQQPQSTGTKVYLHGIELSCVAETAYAVQYPEKVEPTLLLKRLRGDASWA